MRLAGIKNKITSKIGRQILVAQKNSPGVMFVTGAVGVLATVVLAARATLKLEEVLKKIEEDTETAKTLEHEDYSETDRKKDLALVKIKGAIEVAKLYAPAVALGVISVGAMTGSHVILSRRNAGLSAAYAALDKGFKGYRERVLKDVGEEKEAEYRYDLQDKEIAVEDEHGVTTKTVKVKGPGGRSQYAVCFEKGNHYWKPEHMYNQMFLQAQQNYANDKFNAEGHLFLNDVYRMLGFPDTSAGAVTGWVKGHGDDSVEFGFFGYDSYMGDMFVQGNERSVWLDFNVAGVVYDLI